MEILHYNFREVLLILVHMESLHIGITLQYQGGTSQSSSCGELAVVSFGPLMLCSIPKTLFMMFLRFLMSTDGDIQGTWRNFLIVIKIP